MSENSNKTVSMKMTALADEVRELSGSETIKTIDNMTSDVNAANIEIAEQTDLIAQISTALEGKAGGGGVTLPSLDNPASASDILSGKEAIDEDGNIITGTIATKTSSNLTASGATVTVPAGYYASNATKSVATATQATPTVSVDSAGKITASATQSAGYVSAGTKTGTKQLTTQAAKTITPSTSSQTAVASGRYTTGAITVAAIPSNYEDVATETNAYTTKIALLETAITALETELEGKASGGAGGSIDIETCTIAIESEIDGISSAFEICATIFENGVISASNIYAQDNSTVTLNNVICGSAIGIITNLLVYVDGKLNTNNLDNLSGSNIYVAPTKDTIGTFMIESLGEPGLD